MTFEAAGLLAGPFIICLLMVVVLAYKQGHCGIFYEVHESDGESYN